jgi:hypothetical protein
MSLGAKGLSRLELRRWKLRFDLEVNVEKIT